MEPQVEPILFCLIVDDFGIRYVNKRHADHLCNILLEHYDITQDWTGSRFSGIDLNWDYTKFTSRLSIKHYIKNLLLKWGHSLPSKPQQAPFRHAPINYSAKQQFANLSNASPKLDDSGLKRVQAIVSSLLYYGRAVDNKLLFTLIEFGSTQAAATELTNADLSQLLDYLATHPNDGILYQSSDMILSAHSDAAYVSVSRARSRTGAHIMLSKDTPVPSINGPVLTIAQIIKNVTSSAAEAKLSGLFVCAKAMVPLRNTLIEMGWPQTNSPIQCDNYTAIGVTNNTMVNKTLNSMNMRLWWLHCHYSQDQFRYYWTP